MTNINPLEKHFYPALSGRSKRKLNRQNTIRWVGLCLNCNGVCKFHKRYFKAGARKPLQNVWVCKECGRVYNKEDFKRGKYI